MNRPTYFGSDLLVSKVYLNWGNGNDYDMLPGISGTVLGLLHFSDFAIRKATVAGKPVILRQRFGAGYEEAQSRDR